MNNYSGILRRVYRDDDAAPMQQSNRNVHIAHEDCDLNVATKSVLYRRSRNKGFTLIELMVAVMIFAIISIISYKTLSSLITTKEVVTATQNKWGNLAKTISQLSTSVNRAIPLVIRDENGIIQPAILGKAKLSTKYDAQLEFTLSGFIGDQEYGSVPPKRVGFRFVRDTLYLVSWPVLNRAPHTQPELRIILNNIQKFTISYLYPDKSWQDSWPAPGMDYTTFPLAIKIYMKTNSDEEITRQWAFHQ